MDIDDTLEVTITEVSCSWAESKPTGEGNESLDPSDFKKEGKENDLKNQLEKIDEALKNNKNLIKKVDAD